MVFKEAGAVERNTANKDSKVETAHSFQRENELFNVKNPTEYTSSVCISLSDDEAMNWTTKRGVLALESDQHQEGAPSLPETNPMALQGELNNGDRDPKVVQEEKQPSLDYKEGFHESTTGTFDTVNTMTGAQSVRGPVELEEPENSSHVKPYEAVEKGDKDGSHRRLEQDARFKEPSDDSQMASIYQQQIFDDKEVDKEASWAKSGKESHVPSAGRTSSSKKLNANSQKPKAQPPSSSTTQKGATTKSVQVSKNMKYRHV